MKLDTSHEYIRKLVFDLVGCDFTGHIEEKQIPQGLSVTFDGKSAVVGGDSIPAKARGYMLLAKAIAEGKQQLDIVQKPAFKLLGNMVDMSRGGVMKVASVKKYLDYMVAHGMNMLMLYTEDTYEVKEYPWFGYQRGRYTLEELRQIDDYAYSLGIEVIPCIQTFGHLEQFLRFPASAEFADNDRVLLAGEEKTYDFIRACVATVRKAFRSDRIHIGCDETRGLGLGKYLEKNGFRDRFAIFNEHLARVTEICREYGYRPMMWSDMYFSIADPHFYEDYAPYVQVPQYVVDAMPDCDMVFWDHYHWNNEFYQINIEKHRSFDRKVVFAGGIWTWDGFVPNYSHTYNTMKPAMEECLRGGVEEVIATIWSNDGCETSHMLAIPMFSLFSEYCWLGENCTEADIWDMSAFMTGTTKELATAVSDFFFRYDGAIRAGKHILWSDPLINLLFQNFNMETCEKYLKDSMAVFEKYPEHSDIAYFKATFQACLDKCYIHRELRSRYKANDRAWLGYFAEEEIPAMVADFETLYKLHYDAWYKDYKAHGFEVIMHRYAGAIERLKYTAEVIRRYLAGELECIEELESETLHGEPTKWHSAKEFMYVSGH